MTYKELNTKHSAFLVFVDAMDRSFEVYPYQSLNEAKIQAAKNQDVLESDGVDDCGHWFATEKLPRCRIYKIHTPR